MSRAKILWKFSYVYLFKISYLYFAICRANEDEAMKLAAMERARLDRERIDLENELEEVSIVSIVLD